ncbi:hypothetical protein BN946_scf185007.g85 [Trametes cinnabarina]|uniref:Uncharacterized protein n=1 Tax=Pycnoporus cinnabarinus TaxID=5643 RepID=A0A060SFN3_PYCCI|nr:hypothetical protein BN946_scf185007.g85 [Trametes cinnabarina]
MPPVPEAAPTQRHEPSSPDPDPSVTKKPRIDQGPVSAARFRMPSSFKPASTRNPPGIRQSSVPTGLVSSESSAQANPGGAAVGARVETLEGMTVRLQQENAQLTRKLEKSLGQTADLREFVEDIADRVGEQGQRVAAIEDMIEDQGVMEGMDEKPVAPSDESTIYSTATASELKTAAFFKKADPPVPLKRGFWTSEDQEDPSRLLRPRWDDGWGINREGWAAEVAQKVKREGRKWSSALPQQVLDMLPLDVIEDGLETSYNTLAKRYRELRDKDEATRRTTRMQNRRRRRKVTAAERAEHRHKVPLLDDPAYDWAFQWQYQSTDESDNSPTGPALDPDTEDEMAPVRTSRSSVKARPWIQRAPAYRVQEVTDIFDELDEYISAAQEAQADESLNGNTHHARRRGEDRSFADTKLPVIRKKRTRKFDGKARDITEGVAKIPLTLVDKEWLESGHGSAFQSAKYISDWVGKAEEGEEGEDEYEDEQLSGNEVIDPQLL